MRLKLHTVHLTTEPMAVGSLCWSPQNDLFTLADDRVLRKCTNTGTDVTRIFDCDFYCTAASLSSSSAVPAGPIAASVWAVGSSDGSLRWMTLTGKTERVIPQAHIGAVTCVSWTRDGSTLLSCGEDGLIKLWSRGGHLRSKLVDRSEPIACASWMHDDTCVLYACADGLCIQPLSSTADISKWRAHLGAARCVEWHPVQRVIASGGDDGCFRLWDEYGVLLFSSRPLERAVSAIRFNNTGTCFAVGSYDLLLLCDRAGWIHSRQRTASGTISQIEWTHDGTSLAAACSAGQALVGCVVDRMVQFHTLSATLTGNNTIIVRDISSGLEESRVEEIDFASPVVELGLKNGKLVVLTSDKLHIYSAPHFSSPHLIVLRSVPRFLLQSSQAFALVDDTRGLTVYTYDGKVIGTPQLPGGLTASSLNSFNTTLCNDCLAIAVGSIAYVVENDTGHAVCDPIAHTTDLVSVNISQSDDTHNKQLLLIDRQRNLLVANLSHSSSNGSISSSSPTCIRLASQVSCVRWHDEYEMAVAVSEGVVKTFLFPSLFFIDADLAPLSIAVTPQSSVGSHAELLSFEGTRCLVRRSDGTLNAFAVSPFAHTIHKCVQHGQWSSALACCRFLKDDVRCWAVLVALAVQGAQLDIAEQCLAALDELPKLKIIQQIKTLPSTASRQAALLAYQRRFDAAESLLLSHGLVYRLIQMTLDRCQWVCALKLATQHRVHVETVLQARRNWLKQSGKDEHEPLFLQMSETAVDDAQVQRQIDQDIEKERTKNPNQGYRSILNFDHSHSNSSLPSSALPNKKLPEEFKEASLEL